MIMHMEIDLTSNSNSRSNEAILNDTLLHNNSFERNVKGGKSLAIANAYEG